MTWAARWQVTRQTPSPDNLPELLAAARFGKPYIQSARGIGFGEAYLFYGQASHLRDKFQLNAAGLEGVDYPTLAFPGIRAPKNETWTYGLADVAAIPDMDGDGYPELVFCFPRVESVPLVLGKTAEEMKVQAIAPDGVEDPTRRDWTMPVPHQQRRPVALAP